MASNADKARRLAERISQQVKRAAGKGLNAARIFLTARIKETLSVPAPRIRVKSPGGDISYRATTPAIPGAPPRKLSGRLRGSVTSEMQGESRAVIGVSAKGMPSVKSPMGFPYPAYHELKGLGAMSGQHPFLIPTVVRWRSAIRKIMGGGIRTAIDSGQ